MVGENHCDTREVTRFNIDCKEGESKRSGFSLIGAFLSSAVHWGPIVGRVCCIAACCDAAPFF